MLDKHDVGDHRQEVTAHSHHEPHDHAHEAREANAPGHGHSHGPGKGHGHAHGHGHGSPSSGAYAAGVVLNLVVVGVEVVAGFMAGSMALLADAGHNLADVLAVVLAWVAMLLAKKRPEGRHTYGLRASTIFAALVNAATLLVVTGAIAWEACRRLGAPTHVDGGVVAIVAAIGAVVNTASALLFAGNRHTDLNARAVFLHLAGDAAIAVGVCISGLALRATGWTWLDPAVSLALSLLVVGQTWPLLKQATSLALHAAPESIDVDAVRAFLAALPAVEQVHDLHVWAMSTTEVALTAHLAMRAPAHDHDFFARLNGQLRERFGIHHATLQVECPEDPCHLASDEVV